MAKVAKTNFSNIVKLSDEMLTKSANELTQFIYDYTVNKVKDVFGRRFDDLDPKYLEWKFPTDGSNNPRVGSSAKGKGLYATGDMMADLQLRSIIKTKKDKGFIIGWQGAEADKIQENAKRGRVVTSPTMALSKRAERLLQEFIDKEAAKNIRKNDVTVTHRI